MSNNSWQNTIVAIFSVFAVIVSLLSYFNTMENHQVSYEYEDRDRFRDLIFKMSDEVEKTRRKNDNMEVGYRLNTNNITDEIFAYFEKIYSDGMIDQSIMNSSGQISTQKGLIYYEAARDLEPSVRESVTASEYLMLADMAYAYSGIEAAERYVNQARERAMKQNDHTGKIIVLQALASIHYKHYPRTSLEMGRNYYDQARGIITDLPEKKKSPEAEAGLWSACRAIA
ncbi:hypothetical protein [Rubinisphaera italica]|uniref:Uncharacterized protein n=1 Tax=Rubinisphaera italica TaxID=2527969 RepID=A0A5C5XKY3_9PLAN|nr:hypothetical protein [Rubinisphaera italica]TWT63368.1 hypothetical protein Pan54_41210 [Rubinisphaera italica]